MESLALVARDAASSKAPVFLAAPNIEPFVTPSLTANLFFRVFLGIIANLVCLVPLRHLYRNGEFAAVVFILVVEVKNTFTVIMALVWRNDNMETWWPGYGLCDIQQFVYNGSAGMFAACLLAIMRNIAQQVSILRANPLTVSEKRRRNLVQALIIFPLPIVQIAFTWPLAERRYSVGTLMGCSWMPASTWPYLLFYVIADLVLSVVATIYAVIAFFRFRQVTKLASSALTSNRAALLRSNRAKRRLYLMVLSILAPFLPINITLCVLNVQALGQMRPFNVSQIHHPAPPTVPWGSVIFMPSRIIDFGSFNNGYICILTSIPIFLFFGMTKDAMNSYRVILLSCGLGRIWPGLHEEYDPDKKALQATTSVGYATQLTVDGGNTVSTQGSSRYKLSNHVTAKSTSSGDSTAGSMTNTLTRLISPRLATAISVHPSHHKALSTAASSWSRHLPRNPFPFRSRAGDLRIGSSHQLSPPISAVLETRESIFSLRGREEDQIFLHPLPSRPPKLQQLVASDCLQPHPSEALDLPNILSTVNSRN
ncbi:hypothetical protein NQ176_g6316 [Zarea fungicola]|uniref:Uncharacterized protein n=1 Tax=Zarea fungicola TaxID=93591 RepID=A0ACC1N5P3_9HYPO|nr:hypothetical protein NQ176_g6316 [Lecanicillium fungicola]